MNDQTMNSPPSLALLSRGAPLFSKPLHVGYPNVGDTAKFYERMNGIFASRQLTNGGPLVQEFEKRIAHYLGVRHCIATCNATIALQIAIRALGMGGEVIVPSFTFIATAHALEWEKIRPVFCDVAPGGHHIDPARIADLITPRTSAIIGVHTWGEPCDIEALEQIAKRHHLALLFDAAHAFGCSYNGRMIGNFGRAEVFSFHATKFINCFEGGAIATNDDELAATIRLMANFGFAGYDKVVSCGINAKMHEASAAMGLTNFEAMDDFIAVNRRNLRLYHEELGSVPGIRLFSYTHAESQHRNFQYVVLEIDRDVVGLSRDQLIDVLWADNILARRYFFPGCHHSQPYGALAPDGDLTLPNTVALCRDVLVLPTGASVDCEAIRGIGGIIRTAIANSALVREALEKLQGLMSSRG